MVEKLAQYKREAEEHRAALRERLSKLSAHDIARIFGDYIGIEPELVAARFAEIPHGEWALVAGMREEAA
jgi:hypothetical protein